MPDISASETTWAAVEDFGKQRATKNSQIWNDTGVEPEDAFVTSDDSQVIWDPWFSDCGRVEVDPYKEYGRPFVLWLIKPFYSDGGT